MPPAAQQSQNPVVAETVAGGQGRRGRLLDGHGTGAVGRSAEPRPCRESRGRWRQADNSSSTPATPCSAGHSSMYCGRRFGKAARLTAALHVFLDQLDQQARVCPLVRRGQIAVQSGFGRGPLPVGAKHEDRAVQGRAILLAQFVDGNQLAVDHDGPSRHFLLRRRAFVRSGRT